LSSVPAHADDDATATSAARERFKEGVAYFDQKQYEKARAAFVQAYALKKHPAVLLNLAQSELRSNHERDAAKHFASYLREATDASAAEREAAQAGLTAAKAVVGEIQISAESGGEVLVDGTSEGVAPLPGAVYVDPGTHAIELKKGDRTANQSVSVKAGEAKEVRLALSAEAVAAPAAAPPPDDQKPAEPEADDETTSRSTGKREPFLHWVTTSPAGVIPAGAAVLLGLGAGGFAIASSLAYGEAEDIGQQIEDNARQDMASTQGICSDPSTVLMQAGYPADKIAQRAGQYTAACTQHTDSTESGDSYKTFAIVSGIGAGALAITTVVLYFATAPDERVSASSAPLTLDVIPAFAPGAASLSVVGRF